LKLGRVKMKKKHVLQVEKTYFLCCYLLAGFLDLHFKDDLYNLRRCSYNILNHSKWRKFEFFLPKCLKIGKWSMMG
jgi:hypothetical protein